MHKNFFFLILFDVVFVIKMIGASTWKEKQKFFYYSLKQIHILSFFS